MIDYDFNLRFGIWLWCVVKVCITTKDVVCRVMNIHMMKTARSCSEKTNDPIPALAMRKNPILGGIDAYHASCHPPLSHNTIHPFSNEEAGDTEDE